MLLPALLLPLLASVAALGDFIETCGSGRRPVGCKCDELCARHGDCCRDAPFFVAEDQRPGVSQFSCEDFATESVYVMSTCPSDWKDSNTKFRCEHPDISFRDPLLDSPITSFLTNTTYRNWHCASCHGDLAPNSSFIWPVYFLCGSAYINIGDEEFIDHLEYNTKAKKWTLNMTENVEYLIFETVDNFRPDRHISSCEVEARVPRTVAPLVRHCEVALVDSCPDSWTDTSVRTQCETFTSYVCSNVTTYRNYYCAVCNNNGTFDGEICSDKHTDNRIFGGAQAPPPDFSILLDWRSLSKREACAQETEEYDPFTKSCRKIFVEAQDTTPGSNSNETKANMSATNSSSDFATCNKILLEPEDYVIVDNDTMDVLLMIYNITLQPSEYRIQNDSKLFICIPFDYDIDELFRYPLSHAYTTIVGVSISVAFLVIHLMVFVLTPRLRNLSSMNLASLSVALLLMYCAFVAGSYLLETHVPCIVVAAVTHYGLLAAFSWMFTIAYDISRVLRQTTTRFAIMSGKHLQRFAFYSVCSWLLPAVVVGVALGVDFSDQVPEDMRPGFGDKHCWFSTTYSLLIFAVAPLLVVMILNVLFFSWSAYLIYTSANELRHNSTTHQDFRLYARLALIMGLTWIIGLIAGYVDSDVVWYLFLLFNTLQGLFIFFAFTCTKKIWNALCKEHGLFPINKPSQKTRRSPFAGTATTLT